MRKLAIAVLVVLAFASVPVGAEPIPTPPCATSAEYGTLGLSGKTENVTPSPVPSVGHDFDDIVRDESGQPVPDVEYHEQSVTRYRYRIDLSGSSTVPAAQSATVNVNLTWDNESDFDLYIYDNAGALIDSTNTFNPVDGSGESATLTGVKHCTDLRIDIVNYAGTPNSVMTLQTTVSKLKI